MDFFILLVLNIFIGAIIFLILSLKIEKTSATFQEKKLRKEMSEIITEFNATAERNITLLENRISVLKKLLIEDGSLKRVDFTISDDKMKDNSDKKDIFHKQNKIKIDKKKREIDESDSQFNISRDGIVGADGDPSVSENQSRISRNGIKIKDMFKNDFHVDNEFDINNSEKNSKKLLNNFKIEGEADKEQLATENSEFAKENHIDLSSDEKIILDNLDNDYQQNNDPIDIEELFRKSDDKYALIALLFADGYSVEELSKYSGIPSGEIKLVISLNS